MFLHIFWARVFCFLQRHRLIFLSVYKSCVMVGRSRRGFLFSSKTPSYIFECIQVLCCGWTLPQGLFVFFKNTFLYFWVYTSHVLWVDAPAGTFCFLRKHPLIFLSVGQDDVSSARASQSWPRPPQPPSAAGAIARFVVYIFFFMDISAKTLTFESISGRQSSKKALKSRCYKLDVHEKEKTTHCTGVSPESPSTVNKNNEFARFGTHPRIPQIRCQEPRLGTTLPRAPGARMMWVKTNSLK